MTHIHWWNGNVWSLGILMPCVLKIRGAAEHTFTYLMNTMHLGILSFKHLFHKAVQLATRIGQQKYTQSI